jgi:hypothetical protein
VRSAIRESRRVPVGRVPDLDESHVAIAATERSAIYYLSYDMFKLLNFVLTPLSGFLAEAATVLGALPDLAATASAPLIKARRVRVAGAGWRAGLPGLPGLSDLSDFIFRVGWLLHGRSAVETPSTPETLRFGNLSSSRRRALAKQTCSWRPH